MADEQTRTDMADLMANLRIPDECALRRKETFEYITPGYSYNVELYQNSDGTWYAIGIPRDSERMVVYGSSVLSSAKLAMQNLIDKIKREGMDQLFGEPQPEDEVLDEAEEEEADDVPGLDVHTDEDV